MKLSDAFNATGADKERLDRLEDTLKALQSQKRILDDGAYDISRFGIDIIEFEVLVHRAEHASGKPLTEDSLGRAAIADRKKRIVETRTAMVSGVAAAERLVVQNISGALGGANETQRLGAFFSSAAATPDSATEAFKKQVRDNNLYAASDAKTGVDDETAIADIAAKLADPGIVKQQIRQVKALIDGGKFSNKVKRIAWQMGI